MRAAQPLALRLYGFHASCLAKFGHCVLASPPIARGTCWFWMSLLGAKREQVMTHDSPHQSHSKPNVPPKHQVNFMWPESVTTDARACGCSRSSAKLQEYHPPSEINKIYCLQPGTEVNSSVCSKSMLLPCCMDRQPPLRTLRMVCFSLKYRISANHLLVVESYKIDSNIDQNHPEAWCSSGV